MLEEKVILKVFLELTAKNVDKCYYFIPPNFMYNQTRNTVRDGLRYNLEKPRPKG